MHLRDVTKTLRFNLSILLQACNRHIFVHCPHRLTLVGSRLYAALSAANLDVMVGVPGRSKACHTCKRRRKGVSSPLPNTNMSDIEWYLVALVDWAA